MTTPHIVQIQDARMRLVAVRAELRDYERDLEHARAMAEAAAIEAVGGSKALGANEKDRERALILALNADEAYITAATAEAMCRDEVEKRQAELDCLRDERRERQLRVLERLVSLAEWGQAGPVLAAIGAMA